MSYVIQNYFFPKKNLYFSPKIKNIIFLNLSSFLFIFFRHNSLLPFKILNLNYSIFVFKFFKKFYFNKNILFFYNYFLNNKLKFFTKFVMSCIFLNIKNLFLFLSVNKIVFPLIFKPSYYYHQNEYFNHFSLFPIKAHSFYYDKIIFFFFFFNHFFWNMIFKFFNFIKPYWICNKFFLTNFFYNTYFFTIFNY